MIIGALTFQIGLASRIVSYRVDRRQRVGDRRPGVGVLLAHVALDGLVVVGGVGIGGFDAVHVAVQPRADHPGQHLGVADLEVSPAAVPVVLARSREVRQQDPADRRPAPAASARLCSAGAPHADRRAADAREAEAEEGASWASSPPRQRACAVGRMRISLSDTLCGRETAKAMIWAMSSAVIAVAS